MGASPLPDARRVRLRLGLGAAVVLVLAALGAAVLVGLLAPHGGGELIPDGGSTDRRDPDEGEHLASGGDADVIYVHVLGEVARPGLYALGVDDRVVDAVAAAGGLTAAADGAAINLARVLADGEQLAVPAIGAAPAPGAAGGAGGPPTTAGGLVDLNRADAAALETLPRIGPATAARIIEWRTEHGPFATVDDLLAVTGIGEKTLDGLRDLVTV